MIVSSVGGGQSEPQNCRYLTSSTSRENLYLFRMREQWGDVAATKPSSIEYHNAKLGSFELAFGWH